MAWDEWEHLKAEAAEQHDAATRMQLNQYPADGGGGGGGAAPGGKGDELRVSHESLNGNANSLIELAGLLYEAGPTATSARRRAHRARIRTSPRRSTGSPASRTTSTRT